MHTNVDHKMIETKDYEASLENLNSVFSELYSPDHRFPQDDTSMVAIDTMIVQVVDMVKSHLLYAVREEFDMLQEKIVHLENKVARLENENKFLRQFAPTDVVARMDKMEDVEEIDCAYISGYSR